MLCPNCKMEVSENITICPYCGFKPTENITESYEECPFCKHLIPKHSIRCPFCDKIIREQISNYNNDNPTPYSYNYAGFWPRLGAWFIDIAIATILFLLFSLYFLKGTVSWEHNLDQLIGFIIIIIYHTFFLSIYSSTPGKMLYGLEVIDANTKEKIKFSKALRRSLSYVISSLVFSLGFLWIAFDKERHQGWHDKIAKTLVVKKAQKSLVLPIILSIMAIGFVSWMGYLGEQGYDFSYLDRERAIINLIQQKLSQQSSGFCCSHMSSSEIDYYLKEIPLKLSLREEQNAEQIFTNFSKAVIIIGGNTKAGEFGFGSGFLISPSGLFVTNYHVIKNMDKLVVALIKEGDLQLFDVNLVVAEDPLKDIAVLKIEDQNLPYIIMGDSDLVKVGQAVFALGSPQGLVNTISGGMISQIRGLEGGLKDFQITNPISEGSSGGVLFNKNGEVIGITYAFYEAGQNLNLAIPINEVKDLLDLSQDNYNSLLQDSSDLNFCNGKYWNPCSIGQKFYCPEMGNPICCDGVICHDECWKPCDYGYKFICPVVGNPYCE